MAIIPLEEPANLMKKYSQNVAPERCNVTSASINERDRSITLHYDTMYVFRDLDNVTQALDAALPERQRELVSLNVTDGGKLSLTMPVSIYEQLSGKTVTQGRAR